MKDNPYTGIVSIHPDTDYCTKCFKKLTDKYGTENVMVWKMEQGKPVYIRLDFF